MRSSMKMAATVATTLTVALPLAACGGSSSSATTGGGKVVEAKFAILQNVGTPTADSAQKLASLVGQYTNGTVKIKVYPNSVLGSSNDQLSGTVADTIQFYATPTLDSVVPAVDALELPYIFPSAQVASTVLNGPALTKSLWDSFPTKGLRVLGVWEVGFSDFLTTQKKVSSPSDLKGLRIRVFNPQLATDEYKLVGADAINLSSDQVVTALSTHTIDGADDPPSTMVGSNWHSSSKYLAVTNLAYVSSPIIVSEKFWTSLSASQQAAVQKAVKQTIAPNLAEAAKANDAAIATMKSAGVAVSTPDQGAFKAAFTPVVQEFAKKNPAVVAALQAAITAAS